MKTFKAVTYLLLALSFLNNACQKDPYKPAEDINCSVDYSSHSKNAEYQSLIDQYAKKGVVGLNVMVSTPEDGFWMGAAGYAHIEDGLPMNNCHLHHTASLAKSFTGLVILQLIEEGKLEFDTQIKPLLPSEIYASVPNLDKLTIKHLLQQTSGIPDIFDINFFTDLMNDPEREYTTIELLNRNKGEKALNAPGSAFHYSDPNFMLLSMIIDQIEGDHIKSFQERIFEPLNLRNTYYHTGDYPNLTALTNSYWDQYNNGAVENVSDLQLRLTHYIMGSDGIIASAKDMATFYKAVFEGTLISEESIDLIKTDWVTETDENRMNTAYSHGFMVIEVDGETWIGHTGLHLGASCYVYYNIHSKTTIAVFTNTGTAFFIEKMQLIYFDLWNDLRKIAH